MIKGFYKNSEVIPCKKEDLHFFRRMMRNVAAPKDSCIYVRQVRVGDILISDTSVKRWRIISENGKLFLGYYETPRYEHRYDGTESPFAFYVVEEDDREKTSQEYILCRIPKNMTKNFFEFE